MNEDDDALRFTAKTPVPATIASGIRPTCDVVSADLGAAEEDFGVQVARSSPTIRLSVA